MNEPAIKTFTGVMQVTPKCPGVPPFKASGDWRLIEDPEYPGNRYWVSASNSYGEDICRPLEGGEDGHAGGDGSRKTGP